MKHVNFDHVSPPCRGAQKGARSKRKERLSLRRGAVLNAVLEVFFVAS